MLEIMAARPTTRASRRMCAGCGMRTEPEALVRLVVGPEAPHVAVDLGRRLGGRGVSVHPKRSCVMRAVQRGPLARALSGLPAVEPRSVVDQMVAQLDHRVEGLLSSAQRSRNLVQGTDAVRAALAAGGGLLLVTTEDARGKAEQLRSLATAMGCATVTWGTKASVGQMLSRQELGVVLVTDKGIARAILGCLTQIEALSEGE